MSKQFELIKHVAMSSKTVTNVDAFVAIGGLVDKISDIKLKAVVFETLSFLCECVGPQFVFNQVHAKAENHKNPKVCPHVSAQCCSQCLFRINQHH